MTKTTVSIVCGILAILVTMLGMSACTQKTKPEYADQIAESILLAINEDDYAKFSEHFDEDMKKALPEDVFRQTYPGIKERIGNYVSKEFLEVEAEGPYTIVLYKARFTKEPADVKVRVVFREIEGKAYVSGLWLDSPRLFEQ